MVGVTARDVMSRDFVGVSEGDDVGDVCDLLVDERADDVLVLRGGEAVGVVACHDVLAAVADGDASDGETVEELMAPPPEPVAAEADLGTVLARLTGGRADALPVENGEEGVVGVVTESDVVAAATSLVSDPNAVEEPAADAAPGAGQEAGVDAASHAVGPAATGSAAESGAPEGATQSVCESCGTLAGDLQVVNGQAICPECRDV